MGLNRLKNKIEISFRLIVAFISCSPFKKSKRAAHWQTGRAQVMTQGWPQFQTNGTMPRYMNDSRYFPLSNPITGLDARRQNAQLALADTTFAHISEMD